MKKFTSLLFLMLLACCFAFTGCSGATLSMPQNYTNVNSNGGFVVEVGNYLYYANAFKPYSDLTEAADNDGEKVAQASIKRVEQEANAQKTLVLDEEENVKFENVLNKIAGYETSNMFVVGEYLYFTSPNIHKNDSKDPDKYGKYEFELSTLFRIKLDGSGFKELYTTETSSAKFYLTGGQKQSLLVFDDSKIMQLDCYNNSTSLNELATDVKSVVFPYDQQLDIANIYYTVEREAESDYTGNILKVLELSTGTTNNVPGYSNNGETITLISYTGERLFYTRTGLNVQALYSNDFSAGLSSQRVHKYEITSMTDGATVRVISNVPGYDINCFIFEYNNNIYKQDLSATNDNAYVKLTNATDAKIAFVDETYVYYTTASGIFRVSALTGNVQQVTDMTTLNASYVDFDGRYVYFYASIDGAETTTQYLHRADTNACNNNITKTECVAELLEEDIIEE